MCHAQIARRANLSQPHGLPVTPNTATYCARSRLDEGRTRRHERGAGCGGREAAVDEWHQRGRRSRVVLTPRRWRQVARVICAATVAKEPDHRGEYEGNR